MTTPRHDQPVPQWRLHLLRAGALLGILGLLSNLPLLVNHPPTDRGMIKAILGGLWLMSLLALRQPLKMLPIFLFECAWKMLWLLFFGLPQWMSGIRSAQLIEDMWSIGAFALVFALLIPWGYVWREYLKAPAEQWR